MMLRHQSATCLYRLMTCGLLGTLISACGGGGGSGGITPPAQTGPTFSLDTHSLKFSAANANWTTPAAQTVTGTVTGTPNGTLYIVVSISGQGIADVSNFTVAGSSGQASVTPRAPNELGVGSYTGTVTVHACMNDQTCHTGELAGSPQTIDVTYSVSSSQAADTVMPHTIAAGTGGQLVIRGHGLTGVNAVTFGSVAASSVQVVSDSELHVTYPTTLTAGSYPVALNGGAVSFSGGVTVVTPPQYASQTLAYPEQPQRVETLLYDPERTALYVAAGFNQSGNNQLWKYTYSGGTWSATPEVIAIPELRDIKLSADRAHLLVLTSFAIAQYDAANPASGVQQTLAHIPTSTVPMAPFFKMLALANDGNLILSTGQYGTLGESKAYIYWADTGTLEPFRSYFSTLYSANDTNMSTLAASADGSHIFGVEGGLSSPSPLLAYTPGKQIFAQAKISASQAQIPVVMDSSANRFTAYPGSSAGMPVYDSTYAQVGLLPPPANFTISWRYFVINPQGTRAYVLTSDQRLSAYDISASVGLGTFPQVGASTSVAFASTNPSSGLLSEISPDGGTLFFADDTGITVVPTPH